MECQDGQKSSKIKYSLYLRVCAAPVYCAFNGLNTPYNYINTAVAYSAVNTSWNLGHLYNPYITRNSIHCYSLKYRGCNYQFVNYPKILGTRPTGVSQSCSAHV